MKNKAFSLIEIIVAVAIMTILSGIIGINVRSYLAKAKDVKVLVTLNSLRTAANLYSIENDNPLVTGTSDTDVKDVLEKLKPYLDNNASEIIKTAEIPVGSYKNTPEGDIKYGGKVKLVLENNETENPDSLIWIKANTGTGEYDSKGKKWTSY